MSAVHPWEGLREGRVPGSLPGFSRPLAANGQCTHMPGCRAVFWGPVTVCSLPMPTGLITSQKVLSPRETAKEGEKLSLLVPAV